MYSTTKDDFKMRFNKQQQKAIQLQQQQNWQDKGWVNRWDDSRNRRIQLLDIVVKNNAYDISWEERQKNKEALRRAG